MKSDSPRRGLERAHLKDADDTSHVIHRYAPPPGLEPLVRRFWLPVWSLAAGAGSTQRVLQYPVCLLVVDGGTARLVGVTSGLGETTLRGAGWAAGVMLTPAAGSLLTGVPASELVDGFRDLVDVDPAAGAAVARIRTAMAGDPHDPAAHREVVAAYDDLLRPYLPVDDEGDLVNRVVAYVEENDDVLRVAQVCAEFGIGERALQRLVRRRVGLTPKWLIQRRRLQEASGLLQSGDEGLAEIAAALGYADQSHFNRDFARVTGMTPGQFAARTNPG